MFALHLCILDYANGSHDRVMSFRECWCPARRDERRTDLSSTERPEVIDHILDRGGHGELRAELARVVTIEIDEIVTRYDLLPSINEPVVVHVEPATIPSGIGGKEKIAVPYGLHLTEVAKVRVVVGRK